VITFGPSGVAGRHAHVNSKRVVFTCGKLASLKLKLLIVVKLRGVRRHAAVILPNVAERSVSIVLV
jgi:hypothetical protein